MLRLLNESFVFIHPCTFLMGSPEHEPGRHSDEVQHEVTLSRGYYMQSTLVTQEQWRAVMGNNPSHFQQESGHYPVEAVSWHECQEFVRRVNKLSGLRYRLPSEAEWECACRAGSLTPFFTGEISELYQDLDPSLDVIGWYSGNSGRKTHPVGQKIPNGWGLYDMHGNLSEWCQDWYGPYPEDRGSDPAGPLSGPGRVIRGGSWFSSSKNCRSACRLYWASAMKSNMIGFRLVREED